MSERHACPQCGAELAEGSPVEPCPACLMKIGLANWSREQSQPAEPLAQTEVQSPDFDAPSMDEMADMFPQFEIKEMIGLGGMGAVYQARQKSLDRDVALKIIKPSSAEDQGFSERFAREAKALARLSHQNIVTVHDFGEVNGLFFIVMEYIDGVNLRQAMREGRIDPAEALSIVPKVCDALQYAHEEGIVHRDIKPENILLDKRGRIKIADFGLAKLLRRAPVEMTLTSANQVMGTMHYMAPEQLERPLDVDHRADIYSLGVVLYELMTGDLPIGRFELPSERELDARLDDVVLRTLKRKPDQRYQQISELRTDVEQISSNFAPAPVGVAADYEQAAKRPASSSANRSVPFIISREGVEGAKGLVRFVGDRMTFDFTIGDYVEWSDQFAGFKPGVGKAAIPMTEIGSITYETKWGGSVVSIQSNSLDAVAKIPGHDRGRVDLKIEKRDREAALTLVNAVRRELGDAVIDPHEATADESKLVPHLGLILMGCGFMAVGCVMFALLGVYMDNVAFLWTGIGLALGGGSILGSAFADQNRIPKSTRPNGNLATGIVMICIGFGLMLYMGLGQGASWFVWVGMGLALGGSSVLSSAWGNPLEKDAAPAEAPQKPSAKRADVLAALSTPAAFQSFLGVLNIIVSLIALGGAAYLYAGVSDDGPRPNLLLSLLPVSLAVATFISGWLMLAGARNMKTLRSYGLAITGAIVCMLPTSPLWFITLIFGVWSISALTKTAVKREFQNGPVVEYASR